MSLLLAIALGSASTATGHPVSEDRAIALVTRAVHAIYPGEHLYCFSFMTENATRRRFEIALRENHQKDCGGDPDVMPVRDRFLVARAPLGLSRWDPIRGAYVRCRLDPAGRPACPKFGEE